MESDAIFQYDIMKLKKSNSLSKLLVEPARSSRWIEDTNTESGVGLA